MSRSKDGEMSSRSTFHLNTSDQVPHRVLGASGAGLRDQVNAFRQTWIQIPPDESLNLTDPPFPQVKEVIMNPVQ